MKYTLKASLVLGLVAFGFAAWRFGENALTTKFERDIPLISALGKGSDTSSPLVGIGRQIQNFSFRVTDQGAGLADLQVELVQENGSTAEKKGSAKTISMFQETYLDSPQDVFETIDIPGAPAGFVSGEAILRISAHDNSYWKNLASLDLKLQIDLKPPQVNVISTSHNTEHGGTCLVFFQVQQENASTTQNIQIGEYAFNTYPASDLDPWFRDKPDIYFGYFVMPFGFDNTRQVVRINVTDAVGNLGQATVNTRVKPKKRPSEALALSQSFLERKVQPLYEDYLSMAELTDTLSGTTMDQDDLWIRKFRVVNEDYRTLLNKKFSEIVSRSINKQLWQDVFIRPIAAKTTARFGEERSYSFKKKSAGGSVHDGLDLAAVYQAPVKAANNGIVMFVGSMGIYGNTIVIDHGFSLVSIYGHLSSTTVAEGQSLKKGDLIGRTGETGLAGGDHLHYELRIGDVPVTPFEWLDPLWIKERLESKVSDVKAVFTTSTDQQS